MCFAAFYCPIMRQVLKKYSKDFKLNEYMDKCLHSPDIAEKLRHHLFYEYHIGDDPKQNPEKDGQNGLTEFTVLCAKLNIPIVRLFAPNLSEFKVNITDKNKNEIPARVPVPNEPAMLFVRCFRTRWRPKLRLKYNNRVYKLISVMIGSEHCGHQIAASTCEGKICRWACADADARKHGIGPVCWKVPRKSGENLKEYIKRWWDAWSKMIPVTLFNSDSFCDFSILNRSTCDLEHKMKNTTCTTFNAGVVNCDFVYLSLPNEA